MKKRWAAAFAIATLIILSAQVCAQCQKPMNSKTYTTDRRFCGETFYLKDGINIGNDNVVIDCNHAVLKGTGFENTGITIKNRNNVIIKNCKIANYAVGIHAYNSTKIIVYDNTLMRNKVGLKLSYAANNTFDENFDISLERPVRMAESSDNIINFVNKELEDDFCRYNQCNAKSNFTAQEDKIEEKSALVNALKTAIQAWIFS